MYPKALNPNDVVTNGSSAGVLIARERSARWRADGWRMMNVGIGEFDGDVGMASFVPDYLLSGWRVIEVGKWESLPVAVPYRAWCQRYVWAGHEGGRLRRELKLADEIDAESA